MTRFFQRGGGWVLAQLLLLGLSSLLAVWFRSQFCSKLAVATGLLLLAVGAVLALIGALTLGRNLTPFPQCGEHSRLVHRGIYALIRHPIYTSVMLAAVGWALIWQSWLGLLAASLLIPFFHAKARREEHWLRWQFPEYADYEQRVRRFIPWL